MTITDWIAVGILLLFIIRGISRGFLRSIVSLIVYILVALFSSVAAAFVGRWLILNTTIYEYIVAKLVETNVMLVLVANELAIDVIHGLAFFITGLLIIAILYMSRFFSRVVNRVPIVRGINRFLGFFVGIINFLFFSWIFFFLVDTLQTTNIGVMLKNNIIYGSFTSYIYRNNVLETLIFSLISLLTR